VILAVLFDCHHDFHQKSETTCESSAHGVEKKVGSDSWEKRLPSKIAERRIVSAMNMKRRCELNGPPAKAMGHYA
jgi:hypothetical protein